VAAVAAVPTITVLGLEQLGQEAKADVFLEEQVAQGSPCATTHPRHQVQVEITEQGVVMGLRPGVVVPIAEVQEILQAIALPPA
jgi:hypothetical protein